MEESNLTRTINLLKLRFSLSKLKKIPYYQKIRILLKLIPVMSLEYFRMKV